MPWRLIGFIIMFSVFLVFTLSNMGNKCDISFINPNWTCKDVPVFITIFCSFILGMLCTLPIIVSINLRKRKEAGQPLKHKKEQNRKKGNGSDENNDSLDAYEVH